MANFRGKKNFSYIYWQAVMFEVYLLESFSMYLYVGCLLFGVCPSVNIGSSDR